MEQSHEGAPRRSFFDRAKAVGRVISHRLRILNVVGPRPIAGVEWTRDKVYTEARVAGLEQAAPDQVSGLPGFEALGNRAAIAAAAETVRRSRQNPQA